MNASAFLDTNILVYCYTVTEPDKLIKAQNVAKLPDVIVSTQVLQEFSNTLNKKFKVPWENIGLALEEVRKNFKVHINTDVTISKACKIAGRYGFSFYDSLIIAAAQENECTILYSEDLQDGQIIEGKLKIVNPFKM